MQIQELIQKYPKIFQDYEGNPGHVNWLDLPKGWIKNVDWLCGAIQNYVDNVTVYTNNGKIKPPQPTCTQLKEKYGELRIYLNNEDSNVEGMVYMAEHMCYHTCQECGSHENLGVTSGWISILCVNCKTDNMRWKARIDER